MPVTGPVGTAVHPSFRKERGYVLVVASRKGGRVLRLWVCVWVRFGQACGARLFEAVFTWASAFRRDSKDGFRERRRGRPAVYGYIELR